MNKRIKNSFFLIIIFIFIFMILKYYFSEQNIILTNQSRSSYETSLTYNTNELPVLRNDTNNILVYVSDLDAFKDKNKKRIWEKFYIKVNTIELEAFSFLIQKTDSLIHKNKFQMIQDFLTYP